jgi:hypothetical protein
MRRPPACGLLSDEAGRQPWCSPETSQDCRIDVASGLDSLFQTTSLKMTRTPWLSGSRAGGRAAHELQRVPHLAVWNAGRVTCWSGTAGSFSTVPGRTTCTVCAEGQSPLFEPWEKPSQHPAPQPPTWPGETPALVALAGLQNSKLCARDSSGAEIRSLSAWISRTGKVWPSFPVTDWRASLKPPFQGFDHPPQWLQQRHCLLSVFPCVCGLAGADN